MKISSAAARRALARRRSPRRHGARTIDGTPRLGQRGVPILSRDARLVIGLSATLYQGILQRIRRNKYDVFGARAHV